MRWLSPATKLLIPPILFCTLLQPLSWGESVEQDSSARPTATEGEQGLVGAPFVKYAPETGLAVGVVGLYYVHISGDTSSASANSNRPSSVSGGVTYTQKHQISLGIDYDFYFSGGIYHLTGGFDYKKIPFDFYGIGNTSGVDPIDNYTPLWIGGDATFTRNMVRTTEGEGLNVGLAAEVRHDKILSSKPGGILESGDIPGARGGLSSGLGFIVNYDTRDNVFSTHEGLYLNLQSMFYGKALGSDFLFHRTSIESRWFSAVARTHTIALQGLLVFAGGEEPFYAMAELGGDANMRGYIQGRFRDRNMAVVQAEYRIPFFWRFGLAGFAGLGTVAGEPSGLALSGMKFSAGGGIRFSVVPEERLGIRLDYGKGRDSSELYLSILEAF